VVLIADAGAPSQRLVATTAGEAAARAAKLGAGEDALIVAFGAPDEALRWFERRPLFGKRVLVTRAREQAGSTAALLRDRGAEPLVVPTIEIRAPSDPGPLARALEDLRAGRYAWVAFTSANGVERTWEALAAGGGDARAFGAARLGAIGPATARALEKRGLRPDVVAKEFRGEGLAEEMRRALGGARARVLLARAARARDALPEALREAGCEVDVVAAYETHPPPPEAVDELRRELAGGRVDAVMFTSSSTVEHLCDLLGAHAGALLARPLVACIGPVTAETARARGLRVHVTAPAAEYTVQGLVDALEASLEPEAGNL
jgi:uroporphyrinogen III methyltransferase/synthase